MASPVCLLSTFQNLLCFLEFPTERTKNIASTPSCLEPEYLNFIFVMFLFS